MDANLPTVRRCYELLSQAHLPEHIIKHCQACAKVGTELAEKIAANGYSVNVEMVNRACLLHDIMRVIDFNQPLEHIFDSSFDDNDLQKWQQLKKRFAGMRHEQAGYEFLKDEFPEIAAAIKKHAYKALIEPENCPQSIEEKIVYYADKRTMHAQIVPLAERLEEGHRRHKDSPGSQQLDIKLIDSLIFKLEKELFELAENRG